MTKTIEWKKLLLFSTLLLCLFLCISLQSLFRPAIKEGMAICYHVLIPSLLPCLVLSNVMAEIDMHFENSKLCKIFSKIFSCSPHGFMPYIMGLLCGFPIGAKQVCELHKNGTLSREESNHLLGFTNNCGAAFTIAGVGLIRGSIKEGVIIYLLQCAVSLLISVFTKPKSYAYHATVRAHKIAQNKSISLSSAISSAVFAMLSICGTVCLFKMISTLLIFILPDNIAAILSLFFEITTGIESICATFSLLPALSFALSCAGICFGGISVFVQSLLFIEEANLNIEHYLLCKVFSALLAFILALLVFPFM